MKSFKAWVIKKVEDQSMGEIRLMDLNDLPEGDLLIKVAYSGLNYKDALACTGNGNIIKEYPFVPGIDLAGIVVSSKNDQFREGDQVIVTGYGLGVSHFGGLSEFARIPSEWALKLPRGLSLKEAMIVGTAGFTAALSILELQENGILSENGPILITGASGGVGSISVAILTKLGYEVVASTGKPEMSDYLFGLGAERVISREKLILDQKHVLDKQLWSGAIDCVGGKTLSSILPSIQYSGVVAMCGLTGGPELKVTVYPFILRGIRLIGIDSVMTPMIKRKQVWELLASTFKFSVLESMYEEISLEQVLEYAPRMIEGESKGRIVIKL